MSIIEVSDIDVFRGRRGVLRDVSLEVLAGEFVALVGGNGAGKTTLLDTLSGDLRLRKGTIRFLGRPLRSWSARELAEHRAYLTQQTRMTFEFCVEDVVGFGLRSPDEAAVERAMDRAGVLDFMGRRVTRLSGGERRRVHFARLLAQVADGMTSELVLLDEPTAALDPKHAHDLLQTTFELTRSGTAVVAVMHDLNLAAAFADRVVMMRDGAILASGHPSETITPTNLQAVYQVASHVIPHPDHGRPVVVPVGQPS